MLVLYEKRHLPKEVPFCLSIASQLARDLGVLSCIEPPVDHETSEVVAREGVFLMRVVMMNPWFV